MGWSHPTEQSGKTGPGVTSAEFRLSDVLPDRWRSCPGRRRCFGRRRDAPVPHRTEL